MYKKESLKRKGERRIIIIRKSCRWLITFRTAQALAELLRSKVLV
jgi:hypothetical protein